MKKTSDAQKRASAKYYKENTVIKSVKFNMNTDKDLLDHIAGITNFQQYIKSLIKKDMEEKEMKKIYTDIGGECEYYIIKLSDTSFESHGLQPCEDGWKHYEMTSEITEEDIKKAAEQYGEEDAEFLAAMDDLQYWCDSYEILTEEEKEDLVKEWR